jgi:hypothetical protein
MRVGLICLLDFVRRNHAASLDLSLLIVSFNLLTAVWRFDSSLHQLSIRARD